MAMRNAGLRAVVLVGALRWVRAPPVDFCGDLKSNGLVFGPKCYGCWSEWSECHKNCWKVRDFSYIEKEDCRYASLGDKEREWEMCSEDTCPLSNDWSPRFVSGVYESMRRKGLNSGMMEDIGDFVGSLQIFLQSLFISVIIIVAGAQHLEIKWLPDIAVAIPVAALGALIARITFRGVSFGPAMTAVFGTIVSRVMNDFLIPISIFEGAYHCQRLNFYSQFFAGLTFAVFGTLLSAIWIAVMVKKTGDWNLHDITSWRESFAYAAFIADIDPVATLSIFSKLKVDALLSAVVAGEATLNDPIALVVFNLCNVKEKEIVLKMANEGVKTLILFSGSITLGLLMGLVMAKCILIFKVQGKGPLETAYVFQSAYFAFCVGEAVGMSGIIVTLFAGLMMGIYADPLLEDAESVNTFLFNAARIADTVMFLIIGFTFFLIDSMKGIWLGLLTIIFCFVSRALTICILVPLVNLLKYFQNKETISFPQGLMILHSGLRGGMTVMMALMLNPYWMGEDHKETMVVATIVTVTGMCYLCGCTGPFFLNWLQIPMNVPQDDGTLYFRRTLLQIANSALELIIFGNPISLLCKRCCSCKKRKRSEPPSAVGREVQRPSECEMQNLNNGYWV